MKRQRIRPAASSAAVATAGGGRSRWVIVSTTDHGAAASCSATVVNVTGQVCCARCRGVGAKNVASRCRFPGEVVVASTIGRLQQTSRTVGGDRVHGCGCGRARDNVARLAENGA